ncbi:glycosyltransferase [Priestia aryabhattai]|uniref:glycosyltransferase family 32 protein n=1 Tax=Priestia aryabhattai TaxID=412384 RepID=UPI003D2C967D
MSSIPKKIHYCWFGRNPLPELTLKCIESWKKHLPDYEIIEWNEDNFDVNINSYVKEAYEAKKYAFVSDYARIYALHTIGGIYMDTDVEVVKPLDILLDNESFSGFENKTQIPTGIMAAQKGTFLFEKFLKYYENRHFIDENGNMDLTTNVQTITKICLEYGFIPNNKFQVVKGFALYPKTYFCPLSHNSKKQDFSENTYTIHHFAGSWLSEKQHKRNNSILWRLLVPGLKTIKKFTIILFGEKGFNNIKRTVRSLYR